MLPRLTTFSRSNSANGPAFGAAAAQLFEFDQNGNFVREIGKGLYAWSEAHSVRIDRNDNIWAIDKGSVRRAASCGCSDASRGGRRRRTARASRSASPTDISTRASPSSTKNGDWVKSWGSTGTGPGQFDIPHSIRTQPRTVLRRTRARVPHERELHVGETSNWRVQKLILR
jgi:hypothetical protein